MYAHPHPCHRAAAFAHRASPGQDLNWKTYCKHAHEQDHKCHERHLVRTPPKEGTISDLIAPGVPVYRAATPGSRPATGRSPTALSNAGKRMLQEAHTSGARPSASRGGAKPGTASSRRTARGSRLRTGSSRRYVRRIWSCACACVCSCPCAMRYSPPGSAAFTPQTRQDIAELKVGLASVWLPSATLANARCMCCAPQRTLRQQSHAQKQVEQRVEQILEAVEVLKKSVLAGK